MKVVIHDHKSRDDFSWAKIIAKLATKTGVRIAEFVTDRPSIDMVRPECGGGDTIIFLHSEQWRQWNIAQENIVQPLAGILVHVGTNGFSGQHSPFQNRRYASRFTAKQFAENGRGEAFFASVANGHPDWEFLNPAATEELRALKILCEAWKFVFVAEKKKVAGISVHAPETPAAWFKPFDWMFPAPVNLNSEEEKRRIHKELPALVALMGDAEGDAMNLLTAVITGDDLRIPVETFLDRFPGSKPAATKAGT